MIAKRFLFGRAPRFVARFVICTPAKFSTFSSLCQTSTSKTLKASSFALPREQDQEQARIISKELEPFKMTQLVSGKTDLKMGITEAAKDKLQDIAKYDDGSVNTDFALRVKVESGGCHGFQYNFELTTLSKELSEDAELAVFQRTDMDVARVIFDESSLEILQDSKLDYTTELIGSSFKMVDSPYTSTSCGCGASFDFDFEKLEKAKSQGA